MDRRFFRDPANIFNPHAQRLDDLNNRLFRGLNQWIVLQKQKITGMIHQVVHLNPNKNIFRLKENLSVLNHRLAQNIKAITRLEIKRFDSALKNLNALSPLAILDRGYSITSFKGKVITKTKVLKQGNSINIQLAEGKLDCTVDKVIPSKNNK